MPNVCFQTKDDKAAGNKEAAHETESFLGAPIRKIMSSNGFHILYGISEGSTKTSLPPLKHPIQGAALPADCPAFDADYPPYSEKSNDS